MSRDLSLESNGFTIEQAIHIFTCLAGVAGDFLLVHTVHTVLDENTTRSQHVVL